MGSWFVLLPWLACTELTDGATRQVFVDSALDLDRVAEGEPRDRVLAMTDAGWLNAGTVGIAKATAFASELDRMLVDDALSPEEVERLGALSEGWGVASVEAHRSELMGKRQAESDARKVERAALSLDPTDVWPSPGPMAERGASVGFTPRSCHRPA